MVWFHHTQEFNFERYQKLTYFALDNNFDLVQVKVVVEGRESRVR